MKNLIVFKSKHGTTRKIAMELQDRLGTYKTDLADLSKVKDVNLSQYDTVLIGGSIHMAKIQKKLTAFCDKHLDELLQKKIGLFMCFMDMEHGKEEFEAAFPKALREHSDANGLFGGEFLFEEMNFMERMIIRKVSGVTESVSKIDHQAVKSFIELFETTIPDRGTTGINKVPHLYR